MNEHLLNTAAQEQWKKIGIKHHHGICIPLFSLLTQNSCGIGEYLDLLPLIDFCKDIGFDVIQLLPLNDTGWESSPYNALSAFALNPIHLSVSQLPHVQDINDYKSKENILKKYNSTPRIKHEAVRDLKREFLKEYFHKNYQEYTQQEEFQKFLRSNNWLEPYALFKAIKEEQEGCSWEEWPLIYKSPSNEGIKELYQKYREAINFHIFLQYFCFKQLSQVKTYASEKGLLIKGDIPILLSRDSADVWFNRRYFLLNYSAGAPPDMYAKEGQSWGFPVYDWEEMEKSDYSFWKERLKVASSLYHLYRIDHVVGFFRIWAIREGKKGKEGFFIPPQEEGWLRQGKKIMEMMLQTSDLLPIAEDLGTVPLSVRSVLKNLGICGTKVMRWERRWDGDGGFISPSSYDPESMTTVSTHDSDTLQLWWRHAPKEALLFCKFKGWDFKPFLSADRHYEILKDSHHSSSLFHINLLQEYLALFPELVSANLHDERINIPGKILATNWTYRLRFPLEKLRSYAPLIKVMRELIS